MWWKRSLLYTCTVLSVTVVGQETNFLSVGLIFSLVSCLFLSINPSNFPPPYPSLLIPSTTNTGICTHTHRSGYTVSGRQTSGLQGKFSSPLLTVWICHLLWIAQILPPFPWELSILNRLSGLGEGWWSRRTDDKSGVGVGGIERKKRVRMDSRRVKVTSYCAVRWHCVSTGWPLLWPRLPLSPSLPHSTPSPLLLACRQSAGLLGLAVHHQPPAVPEHRHTSGLLVAYGRKTVTSSCSHVEIVGHFLMSSESCPSKQLQTRNQMKPNKGTSLHAHTFIVAIDWCLNFVGSEAYRGSSPSKDLSGDDRWSMIPEGHMIAFPVAAAPVQHPPRIRGTTAATAGPNIWQKGLKVKVLSRLLGETVALSIVFNDAVVVNRDGKQHRTPLPRWTSHLCLSFKVSWNISAMMKDTVVLIGRPGGLCKTVLLAACRVAASMPPENFRFFLFPPAPASSATGISTFISFQPVWVV